MAMLGKVRRLYFRDGLSISEIGRRTSLSRNTVKRWLREPEAVAPRYRRRAVPTKLAPFVEVLKAMLEADGHRPKAQRRTAKALHLELISRGYAGGYTRLTDYIRDWRQQQGQAKARSAFVPLKFELGEDFLFDWSEEGLVVGGLYR